MQNLENIGADLKLGSLENWHESKPQTKKTDIEDFLFFF